MRIDGNISNSNTVAGNFIGVNAAGDAALANHSSGVVISTGSANNIIGGVTEDARNLISGNLNSGVQLENSAGAGNKIQGNYIGTDVTGLQAIGNSSVAGAGVTILPAVGTSFVGTDGDGVNDAEEGNVISGNDRHAIRIQGSLIGHVIAGNLIGTDVTGRATLGNNLAISIVSSSNNRIGTDGDGVSDALEGNVIAGDSNAGIGIFVSSNGAVAENNVVAGNWIGTDKTGVLDLGNTFAGVSIRNASNNVIGGDTAVEGNTIAFNSAGISIIDNTSGVTAESDNNTIRANRIYDNAGLGIDLGSDGVTDNDPGDVDGSPNDFQNFPVLQAAVVGQTTRVVGSLN